MQVHRLSVYFISQIQICLNASSSPFFTLSFTGLKQDSYLGEHIRPKRVLTLISGFSHPSFQFFFLPRGKIILKTKNNTQILKTQNTT